MNMAPGEKMIWAAAYALVLHERGRMDIALKSADKAVNNLRHYAMHACDDTEGALSAREMMGVEGCPRCAEA